MRAAGGRVRHGGPERGEDADAVRVPGLPAREPGAAAEQPHDRQDLQGAAARAGQAARRRMTLTHSPESSNVGWAVKPCTSSCQAGGL